MRRRTTLLLVLAGLATAACPAPSASATTSTRAISIVNGIRAASGIPRLLSSRALNAGCRNHARYMALNHGLVHGERRGRPGYTPSGSRVFGGEVVARSGPWRARTTPWTPGAPFHTYLMLDPHYTQAGYGENHGYQCFRMAGRRSEPSPPRLYSYPADGATGVPTSERANEGPNTPGEVVGIPSGTETGPNILFFSNGYVPPYDPGLKAESATLVGPSGSVPVKMVVASTPARNGAGAGLLNGGGGVMIPVDPLAAGTRYTATVKWIDPSDRRKTQTVSFTTR